MPSSKHDGFTPKWEYVYFFTKRSKSYYFDLDSIRKPLEESSIKRISQKNIPNQFKSGKSFDFAETNPVNNIPKILNNMHKKYDYTELRKDFSKYPKDEYGQKANIGNYLSIQKRRNRSYIEAEILYPDDPQKQKDYIKNVHDHSDNLNGANPGDILFDDTIYDLYTDPNIQDAFIEYLERERPELLMPSILDIPTMPHSFAHFAVMPETLVEPLIKAGCPSDVCIKCGKPKMPFFIDTGRYYNHTTGEATAEYTDKKFKSRIGDAIGLSASSAFYTRLIKEKVTNWIPSCNCNVGFKPGVVLDPFAGSGTVCVVAKKQGKSAILIEISPEYVEIIKSRLEIEGSGINTNVKFVDVASIESMEEDE